MYILEWSQAEGHKCRVWAVLVKLRKACSHPCFQPPRRCSAFTSAAVVITGALNMVSTLAEVIKQ